MLSTRRKTASSTYFDKIIKQVDSILQGLFQVIGEGQVLSVVTDLLHPPTLGLLGGLFCPVFIIFITILHTKYTLVEKLSSCQIYRFLHYSYLIHTT